MRHMKYFLNSYRKDAFSEYDNVHVQRFQVCWTVWVLIEATETYKVVVPEELDLFACLLHLDIFRRQRMDIEHLKVKFRSIIQGLK